MAGLVPATPSLFATKKKYVDARHKAEHDGQYRCARIARAALRDWQDTIASACLCNRPFACQNEVSPEYPLARSRPSLALRASRAADPHSVADADRRSRHRPLRLFAGAAGPAG